MRRYLEILRTPHVGRLFATSLLARLPIGINGLAIVLLMRAETGSFAAAGATAGALALGTGLGAPLTSRLVDARGVRLLVALAGVSATALLAVVLLARAGAPTPAIAAAAFLAGGAFPPTSSVVRARYGGLFGDRPGLVQSAFALDSVLTQVTFTVAPLITTALVLLFDPAAALVASSVTVLCGTGAMVAALPPQPASAEDTEPRSRLGALASPGIRTLVASMLPVGFAFGSLEVVLPAFAYEQGRPELAGLLFAVYALSSVVGGLTYGARTWSGSLAGVHLRVALLLPLGILPLALAGSPLAMALLVVPAGALISPLIASRNELVGVIAPAGVLTEALSWPLMALVSGIAAGSAAAGALADTAGWQAAVLAAAVAAGLGAAVSAGRRATLVIPA